MSARTFPSLRRCFRCSVQSRGPEQSSPQNIAKRKLKDSKISYPRPMLPQEKGVPIYLVTVTR
eukprot:296441-Hanusia_phi.AAC.3